MSTLNANFLTLLDWAKRVDPNGKTSAIAELLSQSNEILTDMVAQEGNLPTGHRMGVRTGLPSAFFRIMNAGVAVSKSTTAQIDEQTSMLEAWSEVDKDLAELNGNVAGFRLSEASAFVEAMNQTWTSTVFYGNSAANPEQFTGFSPRYSTISGAANGSNVLSAGGTQSDNASIWLICWGPQTVFGIYPKGSKAGLNHEDLGLVTVESAGGIGQGTRMRAYRDHWQWKSGIALKDWRYVVRICNIDISNLVAESSAANLVKLMIKAIHRIPNLKMGKPAFYMNRTCFEMLDIQRRGDVLTGGQLTYEKVDGVAVMSFRGIPIRRCDALLETEAQVI